MKKTNKRDKGYERNDERVKDKARAIERKNRRASKYGARYSDFE